MKNHDQREREDVPQQVHKVVDDVRVLDHVERDVGQDEHDGSRRIRQCEHDECDFDVSRFSF